LISLSDPEDPRIEAYRDVRERDLVGRQGLFVAEGKVVIEKVVRSRTHQLLSLLIASKRVHALEPMLAQLPRDFPVFVGEQTVIDALAGFPVHRGILAVGRRAKGLSADALLSSLVGNADVVVLSGIANHDNMGGIFRNAVAFGARAVLLGPDCCDPLYRKAIRVSVGATLLMPFAQLTREEDPLALLERHRFEIVALSPSGETSLTDWRPTDRTAVALGAEGPGLPLDVIERTNNVRIEMAPGFDSLNVATASGIVLHHLSSRRA